MVVPLVGLSAPTTKNETWRARWSYAALAIVIASTKSWTSRKAVIGRKHHASVGTVVVTTP